MLSGRTAGCGQATRAAFGAKGLTNKTVSAPPARSFAPWNPKLMRSYGECQARMALGRWMQDHMIRVSAQQSHELMLQSCGKLHVQGV